MFSRLLHLKKILTQLGYDNAVSELGIFVSAASKYKVKSGDTLTSISGKDVQFAKLIEDANPGVKWRSLQIGQELNIPDKPIYPNSEMMPSTSLKDFIKKHETFKSMLYDDGFGNMTIGYGHVLRPGESLKKINRPEAEKILNEDMLEAANFIKRNVSKKLTQFQFDALTSLVFNAGGKAVYGSALFKAIDSGDFKRAAGLFVTTLIGENQAGVQKRRVEEAAMFKGGTGVY